MASIIEKRRSLHQELKAQKKWNENLREELSRLEGPANIGLASFMIAHEINNLLTPLSNYAELALRHPADKSLTRKALEKMQRNSRLASEVMESMLSIANSSKQEKESCNLRRLVKDVFKCLCRDFSKDGIKVDIDIPDDLRIFAVPVQIQQVLMNLILNARDAMLSQGGTLRISGYSRDNTVEVSVQDSGAGIPKDMIDKVFEPFVTTKKSPAGDSGEAGAGFGLAFCRRVIEEHQGHIRVDSERDKGTTFTITLKKPEAESV